MTFEDLIRHTKLEAGYFVAQSSMLDEDYDQRVERLQKILLKWYDVGSDEEYGPLVMPEDATVPIARIVEANERARALREVEEARQKGSTLGGC